jgi:molybdenum cofactor cytidylyltransferase
MHETYVMLAKAARPDRIVTPYFSEQRGNPVVIGRQFFSRLAELKGDSGARQLMQQHPELVEKLDVGDPGILRDIDTPAALLQMPGFNKPE